jgi:hypothetical protein
MTFRCWQPDLLAKRPDRQCGAAPGLTGKGADRHAALAMAAKRWDNRLL